MKKCDKHYNDRKSPPKGDDKHRKVKECLEKLASGFCLLDGVGSQSAYGDSWDDPQHVLNQGLERARSGAEFERFFHEFIERALDFLDKSAFVLAFDDIDTKFEKGWPVLEVIRKYLTTPQLILLISGDFGLYSQLVRREQYLNLGDSLLRHDRPHRNHHGEDSLTPWGADPLVRMVDRLEDQYLQKVLKSENRIILSTLAEMEDARPRRYHILVKTSDSSRELPISKFIDGLLKRAFFVNDSGDAALYRRAILSQPLRTVIQFLKAGDKVVAEGDNAQPGTLNEFRASLPNIFASALYHKNLDPIAIAGGDPDALIAQMIAWSEATDSWETSYRLRPEYDDADQNMVAIVFASQFANIFNESPGQALVYMIKLGLTREFMLQRGGVKTRAIVQALGLDMRERPSTVARRAIGVQRALSRQEQGLNRGTFPVSGAKIDTPDMVKHLYAGRHAKGKTSDVAKLFKDNRPKLDSACLEYPLRPILAWWSLAKKDWNDQGPWRGYVYNTLSSLHRNFSSARIMHLAACITSDARSKDRSHVSIFPLIACLAELLEISTENGDSERLAQVRKAFVRLCQLRSYPAPNFGEIPPPATESDGKSEKKSNTGNEDDEYDENSDGETTTDIDSSSDEENLNEFTKYFSDWLNDAKYIHLNIPPSIYSRIITRLYYTLTRMDDDLTAGTIYTGAMLHRQIVAFLNAVLVEEMLANGVKRKIIPKNTDSLSTAEPFLDNPTTSDTPFWLNFPFEKAGADTNYKGQAKVDFTSLPLFKLLFSCPLWGFFLMPQTVVARGNRVEGWNLLEQQLRCWPDDAPDDAEMQNRFNAIRIENSKIGSFKNLWAPLNSVPVLKQGAMQNAVWEDKIITLSDRLPREQSGDISTTGDTDAPTAESGEGPAGGRRRGRPPKKTGNTQSEDAATTPDAVPDDGKPGDVQGG